MDQKLGRNEDVTQMLLSKVEAPEETSHGVVLDVPESSYIKEEVEEVLIGQEENQLCVKEESSTDSVPVSTTSIKSEDDAQLHKHLKEEDYPTSRSNPQLTGIIGDKDFGGDESTWNPYLNSAVEICNSSEMEVCEDDEEYKNVNHSNFEKGLLESDLNDSEHESRASVAKRSNGGKSLICCDCGEQFTKLSLKRRKTQGCSSDLVCKKCFKVKKSVDSQNTVQTKPTSFTCEGCGKTFAKKNYLNQHKIIHTGEKPFCCDVCGHCFSSKSHLVQHRRIHTGEKPFCCDLCGQSFGRSSHLREHRRTHTVEKPFCCDLCGHSFRLRSSFVRHKKIHTGEKPFCCDLCGHSFSLRSHLVQHKRIHTGEKPFCCDFCGRGFSQKAHLDEHRRIHTGEKPFSCGFCGHSSSVKSNLDKHMLIHVRNK